MRESWQPFLRYGICDVLGKCKSFILSIDHTFRSYGSQVVTEHDQTEAWSSFVTRDTCTQCGCREVPADNEFSLLAGIFFTLLLSSVEFSTLSFRNTIKV